MDTVRWTCDECGAVNVVVLLDSDLTVLTCRECGTVGKLSMAKPVSVVEIKDVAHTGV